MSNINETIGCVNHDCDKCKAVQEPWGYLEIEDIESQREYPHNCRNVNLWHEGGEGMVAIYTAPPAPQPVPVQDAEGENKAVRSFLMIYGHPGLTVGQMKNHMGMCGFKVWPTWVDTEPDGAHLTKAGAQLWIRHLFALETPPTAQPAMRSATRDEKVSRPGVYEVPVKTYHGGKPWPVAPKPWVGLTDEDIEQGHKESWVDKQAFESAVWWAEKKLKEKNL